MEIWQIFQIANVIQAPVSSVYPQQTNPHIRLDLNRIVWCKNVNANSREPINLMWTPMQVGNNWPYHFIPVLKVVRILNVNNFQYIKDIFSPLSSLHFTLYLIFFAYLYCQIC